MKNTGAVFANDVNESRCKALIANVHRLGVKNCIVSTSDGRSFPKVHCLHFLFTSLLTRHDQLIGGFDRVLLDAPCAGLGVISRDPSIKIQKVRWCNPLVRLVIIRNYRMKKIFCGANISKEN